MPHCYISGGNIYYICSNILLQMYLLHMWKKIITYVGNDTYYVIFNIYVVVTYVRPCVCTYVRVWGI